MQLQTRKTEENASTSVQLTQLDTTRLNLTHLRQGKYAFDGIGFGISPRISLGSLNAEVRQRKHTRDTSTLTHSAICWPGSIYIYETRMWLAAKTGK